MRLTPMWRNGRRNGLKTRRYARGKIAVGISSPLSGDILVIAIGNAIHREYQIKADIFSLR